MPSARPGQQPGTTKAQRRQQRAAAAAEAARVRKRRRQLRIGAGVAAGLLAVGGVVAVIVANVGGGSGPAAAAVRPTATAATLVWPAPAPAQVATAVRAAGLPLLSMEATDVHFHAHLDIIVDGQQVAVPAEVGIAGQSAISSMHTHDSTGIIHIESPAAATFTLGQFFTEWQVPLNGTCVNKVCATGGESWRFYVDGKPYTGDPGGIVLAAHQEIAAVYGNLPTGTTPPDHYDFPAGL